MFGRGSVWSGKCLVGEVSGRGSVWSGKCLVGEVSGRGSVWSGKCLVGEVSGRGSVWSGKCLVGEVSGRVGVQIPLTAWSIKKSEVNPDSAFITFNLGVTPTTDPGVTPNSRLRSDYRPQTVE